MSSDSSAEIRSLASGIRAVALVFLLILAYFNIRLVLLVRQFEMIFNDMLGGKPLPGITTLVIQGRVPLIIVAFAIPIAAIAVFVAVRSHQRALYALAALMGVVFLELHFVWTALFGPLGSIVTAMTEVS